MALIHRLMFGFWKLWSIRSSMVLETLDSVCRLQTTGVGDHHTVSPIDSVCYLFVELPKGAGRNACLNGHSDW